MTDSNPTQSTQGPRASFGIRFVAVLIDGIILGIIGAILRGVLGSAAGQVISLLLGLAYYIYLEGSPSGQTVGKKAMNIRVVSFETGAPLGYGTAALRYICRFVSALPCLLGYFWMIWDPQKQTWHDKIAGTVVVPTSSYPVTAWPG